MFYRLKEQLMNRIVCIFIAILFCWSTYAQNIESISLRIDQVQSLKTNELIGGNDSYIACHNGTAKVRFAPEAKIINRKALERNYFEREYSISDFKIDRKGKYKFRINIEDNHNTRDFYIDIMADTDLKTYSGTVYYYGKPQSRIQGTILDLKMEGESQMQ